MTNDFFPLKNGLHQTPRRLPPFSLHQAVVAKLFESLGLTRAQEVYLHLVGPRVAEHVAVLQHPTSGRRYAGLLAVEFLNVSSHTLLKPVHALPIPFNLL